MKKIGFLVTLFSLFLLPTIAQATVEPWKYQGKIILPAEQTIDYAHAGIIELSSGQLVIAGGYIEGGNILGSFYNRASNKVYFLSKENEGYLVQKEHEVDAGLIEPSMHIISGKLYMFGGVNPNEEKEKVFVYNASEEFFTVDSEDDTDENYVYGIRFYFQSGDNVYRIIYRDYDIPTEKEYYTPETTLSVYEPGIGWNKKIIENFYGPYHPHAISGDSIYLFGQFDNFPYSVLKLNVNTYEVTPMKSSVNKYYLGAIPGQDGAIHLYYQDFTFGPPYPLAMDLYYPETDELIEAIHIRSHYYPFFESWDWSYSQQNGFAYQPKHTYGYSGDGSFFRYEYSSVEKVSDAIESIYWNVLYRPSDPGGLAYWTEQYNRGMKLEEIHEAFATSPERHQIVLRREGRRIYIETLGKRPNEEQIDYLAWLLETGRSEQSIIDELLDF